MAAIGIDEHSGYYRERSVPKVGCLGGIAFSFGIKVVSPFRVVCDIQVHCSFAD